MFTFCVVGTITGVSKDASNGVDVDMGSTTIDMSKVTSLLNASSGTVSGTSTATTS